MRDAPPLWNIIMKRFRQRCRRLLRTGISPGTERHKQLSVFVKCQIPMHHRAKPDGTSPCQLCTVCISDLLRQIPVAVLQALPDVFQAVCPDAVFIAVFPLVASGSQRHAVFPCQDRLDSGRAKFYAKRSPAFHNGFFLIHAHSLRSHF